MMIKKYSSEQIVHRNISEREVLIMFTCLKNSSTNLKNSYEKGQRKYFKIIFVGQLALKLEENKCITLFYYTHKNKFQIY